MPTGYTSILTEKNISFKQFALRCARAFGACVSLRDNDINKAIPKFKPDDYHLKELKQVKKEIRRITKLSAKEIKTFIIKECDSDISRLKLSLKEKEISNNRFKKMLNLVYNWIPPTNDHQGIKSFMIQQLTDSIDECGYYYKSIKEKEIEKIETQSNGEKNN